MGFWHFGIQADLEVMSARSGWVCECVRNKDFFLCPFWLVKHVAMSIINAISSPSSLAWLLSKTTVKEAVCINREVFATNTFPDSHKSYMWIMKLKTWATQWFFWIEGSGKNTSNASKTNEKLTMQTILICPLGASGKLGGRRFKTIWLCIFTNLSRLWFTAFCWNKTFSKWLFRSNASSHP